MVEGGGVGVVGSRAAENLRVACPSESFVALRAVGRHAHEVAALSPNDVAVELVHGVVACCERRAFLVVGTYDKSLDAGYLDVVACGELAVAESVVGVGRAVGLAFLVAAERVVH